MNLLSLCPLEKLSAQLASENQRVAQFLRGLRGGASDPQGETEKSKPLGEPRRWENEGHGDEVIG